MLTVSCKLAFLHVCQILVAAITHNLFRGAVVGQTAHPDDDLSASRQKRVGLAIRTTGHGHEILPRGLVDLDVARVYVMLVPFEGHVSVFLADESHQCLAVTSALHAQAQSYATPEIIII